MRKLVLSMFQSIDGYVEGPGGQFIGPQWSGDLDRWTFEMVERFDTLVYGSVSFRQMAAYWPSAEANDELPEAQRELARFMNRTRKIVFSRNFDVAESWSNSELAKAEPESIAGIPVTEISSNLLAAPMIMFWLESERQSPTVT